MNRTHLLLGSLAVVSFVAFRVLDHEDLPSQRRLLLGGIIVGALTLSFWAHHGLVGLATAFGVAVAAWVTYTRPLLA